MTTIAADLPFSVAVDLSAPAPPALDLVPAGEAAFASAALQLASRPERVALAEPPEVTNHQPSDGPITGALRRTGELAGASIGKAGGAIMRTGAVAGASIVDAFRGLAGAVKKVSPFVP